MSYTRQIILLSILISQISLSNASTSQNGDQEKCNNIHGIHFNLDPLYAPEVPEEIRKKINNEIAQQQKTSTQTKKGEVFDEDDIEEMEFVFASSPQEAQCIVNHLKDPNYFSGVKNYRSIFFIGEPGTGKSIMAKAIAYKMMQEGWEYKFIPSTSLLGEYRNQTSIKLQKELQEIETSNKPTILVIDELNQLLENSNSKHHDTDTTSKALWIFLDKQKNNEKFFLIGTMNHINKLPKPVKSRIDFIEFDLMTDPKIKNNIIRKNLTTKNNEITAEVTDDFLDKELEKINTYSWRELEKVSKEILIKSRLNDTNKSSIIISNKDSISQGISNYLRKKTRMQYDVEEETDDERQNRYHKENLKMHESHFVQQQKIHIAINDHQNNANKSIINDHMGLSSRKAIDALISDEQNQLYEEIMANTETRKAREAAEKAREAAEKAAAAKAAIEAQKWPWER